MSMEKLGRKRIDLLYGMFDDALNRVVINLLGLVSFLDVRLE